MKFPKCIFSIKDSLYFVYEHEILIPFFLNIFSFAKELLEALETRIAPVLEKGHIKILEVFDVGELVKLNCGTRLENQVTFSIEEGEYEDYGVKECKKFLKSVEKMDSLEEFGINLDHRLR